MKRKFLDFSVIKEEITQNNVLEMTELIAFMELRFQIGYLGSRAQKLYADLYGDIKHKNELGYMLSDSYDLVQEGALYLCEHYGKRLSDVLFYSKKGKPITVEIVCIRKMMKLINRKTSDYYHTVSLEALTPASEPSSLVRFSKKYNELTTRISRSRYDYLISSAETKLSACVRTEEAALKAAQKIIEKGFTAILYIRYNDRRYYLSYRY